MKRKLRVLAAGLLAGSMLISSAWATSFPDVSDSADYAEAAKVLNDMGIMQGDSNGNFNPDSKVTRAQMTAILCRVLGEAENLPTNGALFSDVPESFWANSYIVKVASLNIIGGYEDGTFRPNNTVTYTQALAMVTRLLGMEEQAIEAGGYPNGYLQVAKNNGFAGEFNAEQGDSLSRWQVAEIIFRIFT